MDNLHTVEHALGALLLPIPRVIPSEESTRGVGYYDIAIERANYELDKLNLPTEARGDYLEHHITRWRAGERASDFLRMLVKSCLQVVPAFSGSFASTYFSTHDKLCEEGQLSFPDASSLLSHADMVARLLGEERMSCAQVASVLTARRNNVGYNWRQVQLVASSLGLTPHLEADLADQILARDSEASVERFADAAPEDCIEILAQVGENFGYRKSLASELRRFYPNRKEFHTQYSIILYGNLLITEFYDHPTATAAYEFNPRSELFIQIQRSQFPSYRAKESAYLNNSKGAFAFDLNWAWGRMLGHRGQALALAEILAGLSEMSYPARRAFATWLRAWLLRIEGAARDSEVTVVRPGEDGIRRFFERISVSNSRTYGVLEQRAVDCLSSLYVGCYEGHWSVRGSGDSVSASNTSKRKLGDVEYLAGGSRVVRAFEAHGGTLYPFYVDMHASTLEDILVARSPELENLDAPEAWSIEVTFVAHKLRDVEASLRPIEIHGYQVEWSCLTFAELWSIVASRVTSDELCSAFESCVTSAIAGRWVSDDTKATFNRFTSV